VYLLGTYQTKHFLFSISSCNLYQGQSVIKVINSEAEFTMRAILDKKQQGEYPCTTGLIEYN